SRLIGLAENDIVEADTAGGKQRDTGLAAQHGLKAGHAADLAENLLSHSIRGNQVAGGGQHEQPTRDHGEQDECQALQAGRSCQMEVSDRFSVRGTRTIASGPPWPTLPGPTLESLCDPFMAGGD